MKLQAVVDDTLAEVFGPDLADEMRGSVFEGGDCRFCGKELRRGDRVRLEAANGDALWFVWARHATCSPTIANHSTPFMTPLTWRTFTATMPIIEPGTGKRSGLPLVVLNPSLDGFALREAEDGSWHPRLVDHYLDRGFCHPGELMLGREKEEHSFKGRLSGGTLEFDLFPIGFGFNTGLHPRTAELVREKKGFVIALTHAAAGEELQSAPALSAFMNAGNYVLAWVPAG